MKLAHVLIDGAERLVAAGPSAEQLVDVAGVMGEPAISLQHFFDDRRLAAAVGERIAAVAAGATVYSPDEVRWLPPSPRPSKIVGVALNNALGNQFAHRAPTEPAYFLKPPSALVGHREPIVIEDDYGLTHPEPELAAVIGRRIRRASGTDAADAIFGYTIINDITSPALKDRDSMALELPLPIGAPPQWRQTSAADEHHLHLTYHARSKGCDTFAPMGPWLVTTDELPDPSELAVRGLLDDVEVLLDSTARLTFPSSEVVAHLSHYMTLEPGDVVHFGSAFMPAKPDRFPNIRAIDLSTIGDVVSVEIDGIGRLDNPVLRRSRRLPAECVHLGTRRAAPSSL